MLLDYCWNSVINSSGPRKVRSVPSQRNRSIMCYSLCRLTSMGLAVVTCETMEDRGMVVYRESALIRCLEELAVHRSEES